MHGNRHGRHGRQGRHGRHGHQGSGASGSLAAMSAVVSRAISPYPLPELRLIATKTTMSRTHGLGQRLSPSGV
jgi:hypothetical protein